MKLKAVTLVTTTKTNTNACAVSWC